MFDYDISYLKNKDDTVGTYRHNEPVFLLFVYLS